MRSFKLYCSKNTFPQQQHHQQLGPFIDLTAIAAGKKLKRNSRCDCDNCIFFPHIFHTFAPVLKEGLLICGFSGLHFPVSSTVLCSALEVKETRQKGFFSTVALCKWDSVSAHLQYKLGYRCLFQLLTASKLDTVPPLRSELEN